MRNKISKASLPVSADLSSDTDTDATYQTVNLFSSDKCFIYFISDVPYYI